MAPVPLEWIPYGDTLDIVEQGGEHGRDGDGWRPEAADALLAELDALALQAAWLAILIEWELELSHARSGTRPFSAVETPMHTKTKPVWAERRTLGPLAPAA